MVDQALNVINDILPGLNLLLSLTGSCATIYAMSLAGYEDEDRKDPVWLQWAQHLSYALVAFGMLWSGKLQLDTGWHPWPPAVALIFGVNVVMVLRIIAIRLRIRREGRYHSSPAYLRSNGLSKQKH